MREIIFRGKRIDNGEWVYGDLVHSPYGTTIQYCEDKIKDKENCAKAGCKKYIGTVVDHNTVCQYIGLVDKNGRKIFEGDILSAYLDAREPDDITYIQITWNGFSWCKKESGFEEDIMNAGDCEKFEICGNIFDTPELMESQPVCEEMKR